MQTKTVFEKTNVLIDEVEESKKKIKALKEEITQVAAECPHEIVFKFNDNHPKKIKVEGNYFCPACMSSLRCYERGQREQSIFEGSRVIPLTDLSLIGSRRLYHMIRQETLENQDFYYNFELPTIELTMRMEEVLKKEEDYYESPIQFLFRS